MRAPNAPRIKKLNILKDGIFLNKIPFNITVISGSKVNIVAAEVGLVYFKEWNKRMKNNT
jgi:hypothetical protein